MCFNSLYAGFFFLSSADFFSKLTFPKDFPKITSKCQIICIQNRPDKCQACSGSKLFTITIYYYNLQSLSPDDKNSH